MKIQWKKFETTDKFKKLFGANNSQSDSSKDSQAEDPAFEYYYKRGNTYYFRDEEGHKVSVNYKKPPMELIRGNRYKIGDSPKP